VQEKALLLIKKSATSILTFTTRLASIIELNYFNKTMNSLKEKISLALSQAQSTQIFDKAVVGVLLPNQETLFISLNACPDSVFDIASLTKVCPTSTIALHYILKGELSPETPVASWIQELQTNYRDQILLKHLLTHSLDYRIPMSSLKHLSPEEILNHLYNYSFEKAPGTIFNYGNPASILLGILLQRFSGKSLSVLGKELLFDPLHMTRSGWFPLQRMSRSEIIPTEHCAFRKEIIQGVVHDESAFILEQLFPVGSAGMFSTVHDLLRFVQMLLQDGLYEGEQVMPAGILNMISRNALDPSVNAQTALGFELNNSRFMGTHCSSRTFGKTGFTGASIVADPEQNAAIVLLSNFTWPHREEKPERIYTFRSYLSDLIFKNLS